MRKTLLASLALTLAVSGCAALRDFFSKTFRRPTLTFRSASLADASFQSITLNLNYLLENPNPIGINLAEIDYALFVEGRQVVAGKPPNGLAIGPNRQSELVFPANVRFADVAPVVQTFLTQDRARYRAEGHLGVQTPIGVLKFPLSHEDTFEIPKVPAVELGPPRIASLSLQSATLEIPLTVTNRNSFDLPISGLSGALSIGGANVGTVSTQDLGALPARTPRQVTLPLTVHFASAMSAAQALRAGSGQVALVGQVSSGGQSLPFSLSQNLAFRR